MPGINYFNNRKEIRGKHSLCGTPKANKLVLLLLTLTQGIKQFLVHKMTSFYGNSSLVLAGSLPPLLDRAPAEDRKIDRSSNALGAPSAFKI